MFPKSATPTLVSWPRATHSSVPCAAPGSPPRRPPLRKRGCAGGPPAASVRARRCCWPAAPSPCRRWTPHTTTYLDANPPLCTLVPRAALLLLLSHPPYPPLTPPPPHRVHYIPRRAGRHCASPRPLSARSPPPLHPHTPQTWRRPRQAGALAPQQHQQPVSPPCLVKGWAPRGRGALLLTAGYAPLRRRRLHTHFDRPLLSLSLSVSPLFPTHPIRPLW